MLRTMVFACFRAGGVVQDDARQVVAPGVEDFRVENTRI